ncbi:PREDICTED: uncharacterized protein LOC109590209 [Amphimedon queenslandica]|uniref:MARVEL domain-containing protein n=1 Tax=Amphimedon queenslandica TaxID=400682 RepID=A0AAN0JXP8_AMPQE|nr:PREDICTED: uncharacterized protein LOC109590209 [Amphimedon queenslandica]|eukprot:XP_019861689.1 PREDICTED: uncharacterized protein LOC109590209 [Amphimedon queenslandica]
MPSAAKQVLSLAHFVILLLSLGAASTSLGLIQANTNNGMLCFFFLTYSQVIADDAGPTFNMPTCKLSIASAAIATTCLALLTAIELISVLYQTNIKTLVAKILQIGFFAVSILFLFITTVVVAAGWSQTCATFKNMTTTQPSTDFSFQCTGKLQAYIIEPNGAEFIAAAVCAGVGAVLTFGALGFFIVKQMRSDDDEYGTLISKN